MLSYPIKLTKDGDSILATSPDFPELTTFGEDNDDALLHAIDALEEAIAARMANREDIPSPSKGKYRAVLSTQTALKVHLYKGMLVKGVRKAGLARKLSVHAPQVDRLLDLRHASRMDQLDAAFNALGLEISVNVEERK